MPVLVRSRSPAHSFGHAPASTDGRVVGFAIPDGLPHGEAIVNHLQGFVDQFGRDPVVRAAALSILTSRRDNDQAAHAAALLAWVKSRMRYLGDPDGAEWVISPLVSLENIRRDGTTYGDCDDHVVLLGSLLQSIGIRVVVQAVKLAPGPDWDHVILAANIHGAWRDMDPCAKDVPMPRYAERLIARGA